MIGLSLEISKKDLARIAKKFKRTPQEIINSVNQWGQILRRDVIQSADEAGIQSFRGNLKGRGTQWRKVTEKTRGMLVMPGHAAALDSMRPHFVRVDHTRPDLLAWANQSNSAVIQAMSSDVLAHRRKKFAIFVKPHPFLKRGIGRAVPKLGPLLRLGVKNAWK